jgi:FecR protein
MIPEHRELQSLLAELRDGPVLLSAQPELEARRTRLLPKLRARVRMVPASQKRQRRVRALYGAGLAASSLLLGAALFLHWSAREAAPLLLQAQGPGAMFAHDGSGEAPALVALNNPVRVEPKGELFVSSRSSLTTPAGVEVELAGQTRVGLDSLALAGPVSELRLIQGQVSCHVPHLGKAGSFSVITPNTTVIVHGTRFSVAAQGKDATMACVRVSEGLVEVRNGATRTLLSAGQEWGCDTGEAATGDTEQRAADAANALRSAEDATAATQPLPQEHKRPGPRAAQPDKATPSGTLAQENQLMARALSAERRGDVVRARELYGKLLADFPASVFAPEAGKALSRL